MKEFFIKSKNQQGYIYMCSVDYQTITRNGEIIEEGTKYKYGKTRDIEKRMHMYGTFANNNEKSCNGSSCSSISW